MRFTNKACVIVTLGAAFGLGDQLVKSKSHSLKPEWTGIVSSMLQAKHVSGSFSGSKRLTRLQIRIVRPQRSP
ncbi:hypothetical protein Patl1_04533 [Pistacia atlantica]|uniref:Uncharacterized protein n=1 Tax=Pistacia atlantica TaxID=434234 RepID=A0ACC1BP07_9ROSI|nr:hypothetical protein Patl1_04533 [Pistacia atlantica]